MEIKISVVVPVYNEEENVPKLLSWIYEALQNEDYKYEIVLVNDGSSDGTWKAIQDYASANKHVKGVNFYGNFGQSTAMMAGIDYANGEYIVTMDGDLQNDPNDIPALLKKLEEGYDVVAGERLNRKDKALIRKFPSRIANMLIRRLTDVRLRDYGCTLKIFKSDIAKGLGLYGELHRFIPVLAKLQGARLTQMGVKHHARQFGESKYGLNRTFKVMADLILMVFMKKYMQRPYAPFWWIWDSDIYSRYYLKHVLIGAKSNGSGYLGKTTVAGCRIAHSRWHSINYYWNSF
jgi:glycosyltransferase involved in cell wall biosynthesis